MRSKKTRLAVTEVTSGMTRIVNLVRSSLPWFDTHLPLIPVPVRSERPSLPRQRPITDAYGADSTR